MPEEEGLVELKFRFNDGSDLGPYWYSPTSTVQVLKERIFADWPKDKQLSPKTSSEIRLISAGKILENARTVGQCTVPFGDFKGAITMHVVVQETLSKAKSEKKVDEIPRKTSCACTIM